MLLASKVAGTRRTVENVLSKRPLWFGAVATILLPWAVAGVAAFGAHVFVGEKMAAEQGAWDLDHHRALPTWLAWVYALAMLPALSAAIALLMRPRQAVMLHALSLIGMVVQFGHAFVGTNLLAHQGAAATVPFPVFIAPMGGVQTVLARLAAKRGGVA